MNAADRTRYFHGTKHPYRPGDVVVPGSVDPASGDDRSMVWATTDSRVALEWATRRECLCGTSADHRPRVFEIRLEDPNPDENFGFDPTGVMGTGAVIVRQIEAGS